MRLSVLAVLRCAFPAPNVLTSPLPPVSTPVSTLQEHPYVCGYVVHHACLCAAYGIETFATRHPSRPYERVVRTANVLNVAISLAVPTALVWVTGRPPPPPPTSACAADLGVAAVGGDPVAGSVLIFATIVLFLKLVRRRESSVVRR